MREPGDRDRPGREIENRDDPRREQGGWQGRQPENRRPDEPGRHFDHRWAADDRQRWSSDLPEEESWSRPGTGESMSSTGYRGRQRFGEEERFNEFEDYGFSSGEMRDRPQGGRERESGGYAGAPRGEHRARGAERFAANRGDEWRGAEGRGGEEWRGAERGRDRSFDNLREREQNQPDRGYASRGRGFESQESAPLRWPGPRDFLDRIPRGDYSSVGFVGSAGTRTDYTPGYGRGSFDRRDWGRANNMPGEPGWHSAPEGYARGGGGFEAGREPRPAPGPHVGRGPRNYQRSDERVSEEVCDLLMQHPNIDASEIEVEVLQGEVILRGKVDDRRTKHRIEDLVDGVMGVRDIRNELRVEHGFWGGIFGGAKRDEESEARSETAMTTSPPGRSAPPPTPGATLTGTDATATSSSVQAAGEATGAAPEHGSRPTGRGSRKEQ